MNDKVRGPDRRGLLDLATEQHGHFTAAQARACGYSWSLLTHHVASGTFTRVRRGLYRFSEFPPSPREHVVAAWLAAGKQDAVVSHASALDLLDLSDVIPDSVHLTVPRSRRGYQAPPGVTVHTTSRPFRRGETLVRDGIRLTAAARSIVDSAEWGIDPDQVVRAVRQALLRGLSTPAEMLYTAEGRGRRIRHLIVRAVEEAKGASERT